MQFDHLTFLLPCRGLEELSLERSGDEAEQLLAAWSALWHPALICAARAMPRWAAADSPPQEPAGHLVLVPPCCEGLLPGAWPQTAAAAGACVLRNVRQRPEMVAAALGHLEPPAVPIEPELVSDFLALGFCHFVSEMVSFRLRYMSNLDQAAFEKELVAAADEAQKGGAQPARDHLHAAFDLLHNAREYYYPTQTRLLDLTLVASTTLGASLRTELGRPLPRNLLVSGEMIEEMARREPATLEALAKALADNRASLVGGEFSEYELPLLPPEAIRFQIRKGLAAYQRHLGTRPTIFGRRRFGMTPVLPQILEQLGFVGALHATLDDGRFPAGNQSRIRWEGIDGTMLETLARVPLDISRADAFLRLPQQSGGTLEGDSTSAFLLAHWPGRSSPWYDDLRRITAYTSVLGSFSTVADYFQQTGMGGQHAQHKADAYRSPYLKQAVAAGQADPISCWVRYFGRRAAAEAAQSLSTLAALVTVRQAPHLPEGDGRGEGISDQCGRNLASFGSAPSPPSPLPEGEGEGDRHISRPETDRKMTQSPGCEEVDQSLHCEAPAGSEIDQRVQAELAAATERFCRAVVGPERSGQPAAAGILVANPCSFSRQVGLELGGPEDRRPVTVEVPPMGFAWLDAATAADVAAKSGKKWGIFKKKAPQERLLASLRVHESRGRKDSAQAPEVVLRNEFFELVVDPHTGAIRSIFDYVSRGPRLAQQIALRLPVGSRNEGDDAYSIMAADEVVITAPGPLLGEVVARGRLVDRQARRLAGFQQTTRIRSGSRIIELLIELDIDQLPGPEPWSSYYAARFAWPDETASLYRSVNMATLPTDTAQLEAPHLIDIRAKKVRTTILTAGLPYHRRCEIRKLDTLLVVRGETARQFRLGIGIDLPGAMAGALDFLAPPTFRTAVAAPLRGSGWLFHLDARNVIATCWEPIGPEESTGIASGTQSGKCRGFRVRLLETDGRQVTFRLRSFRAPESARKIDFGNNPTGGDLTIEGDSIAIDMRPHEWAEVEVRMRE
ncbi:MAG: hypothetical protein ABSG68_04125 [Thermoguttaceae bacterium]|jgi:alpha-mannosidase